MQTQQSRNGSRPIRTMTSYSQQSTSVWPSLQVHIRPPGNCRPGIWHPVRLQGSMMNQDDNNDMKISYSKDKRMIQTSGSNAVPQPLNRQRLIFNRPVLTQVPSTPFMIPRLTRPTPNILRSPNTRLRSVNFGAGEYPGTVDISQLHRNVQTNAVPSFQFRTSSNAPKKSQPTENITLDEDEPLVEETEFTIPAAIQRAMQSLAPQTPEGGNAFAAFLLGEEPAKVIAYWEARRIQNSARRFLERLEESKLMQQVSKKENGKGRFHVVNQSRPQKQYEQSFPYIFEKLAEEVLGRKNGVLNEQQFIEACTAYKLWPSELEYTDKIEVFCALALASQDGAKSFRMTYGEKGCDWKDCRLVMSHTTFCDGLTDVPYNLPDFPVPEHFFETDPKVRSPKGNLKIEIAQAITGLFLPDSDGMNKMKDFFCSDLVSVEEIQVSLSTLWPIKLVVEASTWIIRCAAPHLTNDQWSILVKDVRQRNYDESIKASANHQAQQVQEMNNLDTTNEPIMIVESPKNSLENRNQMDMMGSSKQQQEIFGAGSSTTKASSSVTRPRKVPQTCPLPPREIDETAVSYPYDPPVRRYVDWTHPSEIAPADQGAGGLASNKYTNPNLNNDVMWLSAELHSEIRGPFLARAFVKCCEVYDTRCDTRRNSGGIRNIRRSN